MIRKYSQINTPLKQSCRKTFPSGSRLFLVLSLPVLLGSWDVVVVPEMRAAEPTASLSDTAPTTAGGAAMSVPAPSAGNPGPHFNVQGYLIEGNLRLAADLTAPVFSRHIGTNMSLDQIAQAAVDLQSVYRQQGYPNAGIVISPQRISNGVVTMTVFEGAFPQIVVAGQRYFGPTNANEIAAFYPSPQAPASAPAPAAPAPAPIPRTAPMAPVKPVVPATPEEMARMRAELSRRMAEIESEAADTRVHVVSTNAGPNFPVQKYVIIGNTVLTPATIAHTMTNIDGDYGTNVSLEGIRTAVTELQKAYTARGYVTVAVGLPQQKLTNATVKIEVTEGRLASIEVKGNHYFSSNNVMRALPSLHTNTILNAKIFQAELNRANANQDRQIYPTIGPGPYPGTSELTLKVKDRLPLHAKVEYNNESTPGTPDLRLNSSVVYNNLWDLEHSLGAQYSFSPGYYKGGSQWNAYDVPLVANYGGFYRMPLGQPVAIEQEVADNPGTFGYSEATRKFNLPPASGQPELNLFASRSTIDTGLETLSSSTLYNVPGVISINQVNVQDDLTVANDMGFRFSTPLQATGDFHSDLSGGLDFKTFQQTSFKTNNFLFAEITVNAQGQPNPPVYSTVASPVPETDHLIQYLPLTGNYNATWRDGLSTISLGLGLTVNPWYSGTKSNLQAVTGSAISSGYWVTVNPKFSWQFPIYGNWLTTVRADGQWADEPLISNEQYGAGGVNSVRGYHEGEEFGDTGYHMTVEQQTPPHVVGIAYDNTALTIRGTVYMDYARVYTLNPSISPGGISLWGTGVGGVLSLGSHWEARFLFSVPLLGTTTTEAYNPFFNFDLTAQF